jgi:hypothetical protein
MRGRCGHILVHDPKPAPLRKFFWKVGEQFGEDLAFATLRAADARQPDPRVWRLGRRGCFAAQGALV